MKESAVRFGKAGHLAGVLTMPRCDALPSDRAGADGALGLVLPSAGLLHRIGPHRMHVKLARLAAARGIAAIRFDMPGIGDSNHAPGRSPYAEQELQAARQAMDLVEQETGTTRFVFAGLCSGADSACRVARADHRVIALFLMEPYYYPGPASTPLRLLRRLREYGPRPAAVRLLQMLENAEAGDVHPAEDEDQDRERPPADEFARDLLELGNRGVHLRLLYAGSSMGALDLRRHRRRIFAALAGSPHFSIDLLPHADHLFTPAAEMRALEQRFLAMLDAMNSPPAAPATAGALSPARPSAGVSQAAPG